MSIRSNIDRNKEEMLGKALRVLMIGAAAFGGIWLDGTRDVSQLKAAAPVVEQQLQREQISFRNFAEAIYAIKNNIKWQENEKATEAFIEERIAAKEQELKEQKNPYYRDQKIPYYSDFEYFMGALRKLNQKRGTPAGKGEVKNPVMARIIMNMDSYPADCTYPLIRDILNSAVIFNGVHTIRDLLGLNQEEYERLRQWTDIYNSEAENLLRENTSISIDTHDLLTKMKYIATDSLDVRFLDTSQLGEIGTPEHFETLRGCKVWRTEKFLFIDVPMGEAAQGNR